MSTEYSAEPTKMHVKKRNGSLEVMDVTQIVNAVARCSVGLKSVDALKVATKTIGGLYDGASTQELDLLSIKTAASLIIEEPEYSKLAANLLAVFIEKEVSNQQIYSFSQSIEKGWELGRISDQVRDFVLDHAHVLDGLIDYRNNNRFEFFGLKTLYDRYFLKHPTSRLVIENPQYFFLRIACGLGEGLDNIVELYHLFAELRYIPSTPTLFNAGTKFPQLSSCFLVDSPEDSLESIYDKYKDVAKLSKFAGGIGISYSRVRSDGSLIASTNGPSSGIIPWLKTLDASVAAVNQGSKRQGACCVYLETWHADIEAFLELRDNTGDEARRVHNINLANWIPDLFMKRVEIDGVWSLFDPKVVPLLPDLYGEEFEEYYIKAEQEKLYVKQVKARDLYTRMMMTLAKTGNGWMTFKDACNIKCNQTLSKENVVHSSNLCVAPETMILTDQGYKSISSLHGQEINIWNGEGWSSVAVHKTGENQKLLQVNFSNGQTINCTPYHRFYIQNGFQNRGRIIIKQASELAKGDKIIKFEMPVIEFGEELFEAYTQGFFSGDGCSQDRGNHIDLYGDKIELSPYLAGYFWGNTTMQRDVPRRRLKVSNEFKKFEVPVDYSIKSRLRWFEGLCDSDGVVCNTFNTQSIQVASINLIFLKQIQFLLNTLGVQSNITLMRKAGKTLMPDGRGGNALYDCQDVYRLIISTNNVSQLQKLGFSPKRLKLDLLENKQPCEKFIKVISVEDHGRSDDTYCVDEPKLHKVVFNGVLTGNCTEITEVNSRNETAVCNLGSINLAEHCNNGEFNYEKLAKTVKLAVRQLNRVIDINLYTIDATKASNEVWRPIGLGIMGLQDVFFKMGLPFDSEGARAMSRQIQEEIYYHALKTSIELAKEYGAHKNWEQTKHSKRILQFDLWGVEPNYNKKRWDDLKLELATYGTRNSLLLISAPTATIASIVGVYESIEPQLSNFFKRETLSGDFLQINKYLVADLKKIGLWNDEIRDQIKLAEGSIQGIEGIPDLYKLIYRTVWEIPMKSLIDMAADRGAFIDQSQSLNLFMETPTIGKLSSMYMYAWKRGLKTTYYLRSRPASNIAKATIEVKSTSIVDQVACSLENPESCESCQ